MNLRVRCIVLAGALFAVAGAAHADDWTLDGVERVVAVSDIHGAHQELVATLQTAGVVDAAQRWSAAGTHLVIVGDIVDRGDDSRASMDLLMRLEPEAAAAGGKVHVVLGNHDVMNIVGDLRYTTKGEYAAFAAEESPVVREAAFQRHLSGRASDTTAVEDVRREFDHAYPPGFFAHRAAFAAGATYGKWLLGKPLLLQINDTLFVHAGMSQAAAGIGRTAINGAFRGQLLEYAGLLEQLMAQGVVDPATDFYELPDRIGAARVAGASAQDPDAAKRVDRLLALHESLIHGPASPLWYRGNVGCGPLIEQARLESALKNFNGARLVVGHTPTWRRRVWSRLDGRVVQIDTGMLQSYYSGQGAALLLEGQRMSAIYRGEAAAVPVEAQPARAGILTADLDAEELEAALAEGEIAGEPGAAMLELTWHGRQLQALFTPARDGFAPDVAAYRLDRLLSLDMVPAAVLRNVNGTAGSLRHVPGATVTETERVAGKAAIEAWCPLQDQFQAMYIFDALVYNPGRVTDDILFARNGGTLILTGHAPAFGTRTGVPAYLKKANLTLNAMWRDKLAGLQSDQARASLREVLGDKRLKALLKRAEQLAD
ncbi:MAG: metallophosphoesterase [Pseudomonadales bacterium]|nr:metallophosphoesterase [Pseudomonadales bacterium]